ncbi:MAG: hypothetical protein AMDU4_FER2C00171G0001 [Ferroplasma sp. Type II]|nr:MAG: hypothetical protein AMDU4_FER2C00171G0001 [Ferroplasma sp. Type II]
MFTVLLLNLSMSILVFTIVIIWFFLLSFVFFKEDFILFFFSSDIMELTGYGIFLHKYYHALECGTLFYNLPILNRLYHTPVQNSALSILSSLLCANSCS